MLSLLPPATETAPPCAGEWRLFDSVEYDDHVEARAICADCPLRPACEDHLQAVRSRAQWGAGPRGTWAGRLYGETKIEQRRRHAIEDASYTDEEALRAQYAYRRAGDRSAWAEIGMRVYDRRRHRAREAS